MIFYFLVIISCIYYVHVFILEESPTLKGSCSQNGDFEINMATFRKLSIENSRQH